MKTLQVKITDSDIQKYNLRNEEIKFSDLVDLISQEYAREALIACNEIAEKEGLSKMSMEEINAEVKAVRDAKSNP